MNSSRSISHSPANDHSVANRPPTSERPPLRSWWPADSLSLSSGFLSSFLPRLPRSATAAVLFLIALLASPLLSAGAHANGTNAKDAKERPAEPDPFEHLLFRHIGPIGNRVPAVTGVPGDRSTYFAGAASGGVWRTRDGGLSWKPVFDDQPAAAIGAIAVAPSDHNVVWVGTGETFIRSNVSIGDGVYRSTDGGDSWLHLGLDATGRIGRIVVDPRDPDAAFVAALGHGYGPQKERGLFRTRDGGATWQQVLFVDDRTGAIDVVMNPKNPRILFAATWQFEMRTSGRTSGGPGSGIWRSADGGDTWERLGPEATNTRNLPKGPWGKIGLMMSAAAPDRIYAIIETNSNASFAPVEGWDGPGFQGVLWRSDDSGKKWELMSRDNGINQRPLYYTRGAVAPDNSDEITFVAVQQTISYDGGRTLEKQNSGWDHHDIWIDPLLPDRRIVGHDGGVSITLDRGKSWQRPQLPIAQIYHVNVDDQIPYFVYGNRQDGPSMKGPSNSLTEGSIPVSAWSSVGGCEVGFAVPTPGDPDSVWTGCYDGILERFDGRSGHARDVSVWPLAVESGAAEDLRYRFQWSFPVAISPHDPQRVYVGSQFVHRTTDGGSSWHVISPDLTSNDPELQQRTGGLTLDDAGPTIAPVVFALAESPLEQGVIWAGTNDGKLQVTADDGASWTDVTGNLPDLLPLGTVSNVFPSRHVAGKAYTAIDRHQEGDTGTHVFRTSDYGRTWKSLRADLPQSAFSNAHCVIEDPVVPGLLFLGTHNTLWMSFDDGDSWQELRSNLPHAPVSWIAVQEHFNDLVLSTYGRGFWILDDLTPLRELAQRAQQHTSPPAAELFAPRDTYRFRWREPTMTVPNVPAAGTNPEAGVPLHYRLSEEAAEVTIEVIDANGETVRTLDDLATTPGLHRVWWDLEGERTTEVELLRPPRDNPEVAADVDGGRVSLLVPPGDFTVRLLVAPTKTTANESAKNSAKRSAPKRSKRKKPAAPRATADQSAETERNHETPNDSQEEPVTAGEHPLSVLRDPHSLGSETDIQQQMQLLIPLRDDVDRAARLINALESIRDQITKGVKSFEGGIAASHPNVRQTDTGEDGALGDLAGLRPLQAAATALDEALQEIEHELFDLRLTEASQDTLRWPRKLYARLSYLVWRVRKTDDAPTRAQHEVAELLHQELTDLNARYETLVAGRLSEFNRRFGAALSTIVPPEPSTSAIP